MSSHGPSISISSTLPKGWWSDQDYAERVYDEMRHLLDIGVVQLEVARRTGVSSRCVQRFVRRAKQPPLLCGTLVMQWDDDEPRPCTQTTYHPSGRCQFHRDPARPTTAQRRAMEMQR